LALILNIETSTTVCSVSISRDEEVIALKELNSGYTHAENLHVFIQKLLKEMGMNISEMNAIAVSRGPGSYTGLRIGVSAAKGLAYALGIPLISVDTLAVMSAGALKKKSEKGFFCPMIDARRMEVYTAVYDHALQCVSPVEALIVDENSVDRFSQYGKIFFFGDGMEKCRALLEKLPQAGFISNIFPSAVFMPQLSFKKFLDKQFEDVAYFEPYYLKQFLVKTKNPIQ
jgi:tRNA threonylcarbamoyladenosine biosynthesis protein TsaB